MCFNMSRKLRHSPLRGNENAQRGAELGRKHKREQSCPPGHPPARPEKPMPGSPTFLSVAPPPRRDTAASGGEGAPVPSCRACAGRDRSARQRRASVTGLTAAVPTSFPSVLTREEGRWCWIWICFGWIKEGTQPSSERPRRSASRTRD